MKTLGTLSLVALISIMGCTMQKKSEIEGAWKLIHMKSVSGGILYEFKTGDPYKSVKIFDKNYFLFVGEFHEGDTVLFNSGGGTYTYANGVSNEHIEMHQLSQSSIGKTETYNLIFKSDTMIQSTPGRDKDSKEDGLYEVYVRIK